jgi:hypothetical protein
MTLRQIQSGIRSLNPGERVELYRWLDYEMAADFCSGDCCSRIGVERAREIRRAIDQPSAIGALSVSSTNLVSKRPTCSVSAVDL